MAPQRPAGLRALAALALLAATSTPASALDANVHGLLDVVLAERGPAFDLNTLTHKDNPFDAYGARLMVDATVSDRVQVFTQLVLRDMSGSGVYVDGAYFLFTPTLERDLHLTAGKIPWPVGTWAPRTYSNVNPLISSPLMYQYHSSLVWYTVPQNADMLLGAAGTGQTGANYFGSPMSLGMPIVDDSYWDVGVTLSGSMRPFEFAIGGTAGTPGWASTGQDENAGKTVLGRIGMTFGPAVRLGVSGAYGPYLVDALNPKLPPGDRGTDYHQILRMADLEVLAGHAELRAEGALNTWESPHVGDLDVTSAYAELKYSFNFGGYVAGRWDMLDYGDITGSSGVPQSWDYDVNRIEVGAGYRFDRSITGKVVWQGTTRETPAGDEDFKLAAAQLSVKF